MQYNGRIPQPTDIPATDSQDDFLINFGYLNTFWGVNHVAFGNIIETATSANPCVIKSTAHGLSTGNTITPTHMSGIDETALRAWNINGTPFVITVIDADRFSLNGSDTTLQPAYVANSGDFSSGNINYGYHSKINFSSTIGTPNLKPPRQSIYPFLFDQIPQLLRQNDSTAASQRFLTGIPVEESTDAPNDSARFGFVTPWGLIINWGWFNRRQKNYTFQIPFTTDVYGVFFEYAGTNQNISTTSLTGFSVNNATALTTYYAIGK